ncbi:MAG: transglycosylase SLT domain-containing protein [Microscillaceae bacterium]|nr:transglycosylase SLT domain-containing protein [Microscillaceae bacterium]MDW8460372.1 transglycosylase SLT domain-containing protein [Cytophagales bacterium]
MKKIAFFLAKVYIIAFLFLRFIALLSAKAAALDSSEVKKSEINILEDRDSISQIIRDYVPSLHEDIIQDRLQCIQRDIKMTYHSSVGQWISFYVVKNRNYTRTILNRSSFYFPIFEEALRKHNLPDELKYLAIVESALQPKAVSIAAAAGLWQFIPSTGREMGLEQDWYIDERLDLYKSTEAACKYLKTLYSMFGDWHLAIASYNCGPGWVQYAINKAGGKSDFWEIYKYLPSETRSYVPAFISVCYVMNYLKEHHIYADAPEPFIPSDVILVSNFVNLEDLAQQIGTPFATLQLLNPHLKKNIVPHGKKDYPIRIPADKKVYFENNRENFLLALNKASQKNLRYQVIAQDNQASSTKGKNKVIHTVKLGQSLPLIAMQYGVQVANIKVWNGLYHDIIYPNQRLEIWTDKNITEPNSSATTLASNCQTAVTNIIPVQNANYASQMTPIQAQTNSHKPTYHIIRAGDNLWDLARKYNTSVDRIRKLNKLTPKSMLLPGQKLLL